MKVQQHARRTLALIYATGCLSSGGFTLLQLVVPLWGQALGAPPLQLGLIAGAGSLLPSLFMVPVGAAIDRRGARLILAASAIAAGLSAALFPFAPNYWWLLPIQVAGGLGRTSAWVASQAMLIQTIPRNDLPRHTANYSLLSTGGTFVFPVFGGLLIDVAGHGAAFALAVASYAVLLAALWPLPAAKPSSRAEPWSVWASYRRAGALLLRGGVLLLLWGTIVRLAAGSIRTTFLPLYLLQLAFAPTTIGLLVGAGNFCGVLCTPATARLQALLGAGPLVFLVLAASATAMGLTPLATTVVPAALLSIVWGAGIGMALPPLLTLVAAQTPPEERGLGVALRNTGNEWAIMLSPIAFGLLVERVNLGTAFVVSGVLALLACGVGWLWSLRLKS